MRFSTCLLLKETSKGSRKPVCEMNRLIASDIPDSFLQENQRHGDIFCAGRVVIADVCADMWTQQGSVLDGWLVMLRSNAKIMEYFQKEKLISSSKTLIHSNSTRSVTRQIRDLPGFSVMFS